MFHPHARLIYKVQEIRGNKVQKIDCRSCLFLLTTNNNYSTEVLFLLWVFKMYATLTINQ